MSLMRVPWMRTTPLERELRELFDPMPVDLGRWLRTEMPVQPWMKGGHGEWMPLVDIKETETEMIFTIELPGLDPDAVKVEVAGSTLTISGEKHDAMERREGDITHCERTYGAFRRSFRLPENMILDDVMAEHEHGVMTIHVPKTERSRTHKVKVLNKEKTTTKKK